MITVKTGAYSIEEIRALSRQINLNILDLQMRICQDYDDDCTICQYRHMCADLISTYNFLLNKARERISEV